MKLSLQSLRVVNKLTSQCHNGLLGRKLKFAEISAFQALSSDSNVPTLPTRLDPVCMALKSAHTTSDALKVIGIHARHMEPEHVTQSLRTLRELHKSRRTDSTEEVLNSEEFLTLCHRLKKHLPVLETPDLLNALKTVTLFKVPPNSGITMKLLHMLKNDINSFDVSQIIFLAFLLRQYPKNSVVDAMKIALPVVFEAQLRTKLDRTNVAQLTDALLFCSKNHISKEVSDYVVQALFDLDQLDWVTMDPRKAKSIVLSLCSLKGQSNIYQAVYRDAVDILTQNLAKFPFNEVDLVLGAIVSSQKAAPYLMHAPLFEMAARVAVAERWSLIECCITVRKINITGIVHRPLLDYMADKILDEPEAFREGKFPVVKTFVAGLSVANYRTDHWNVLKDLLPSSRCFQNIQPREPWIPLCLELASLDIYIDKLLAQVFSPWFLEAYLAREFNRIDLLQLLRLYQAVKVLHPSYSGTMPSERFIKEAAEINGSNVSALPMRPFLNHAFGADCFLSRCKTSLGQYIDHVLVIQPNGDVVSFKDETGEDDFVHLDKAIGSLSPDCQRIAICLQPVSSYNHLKQPKATTVLSQRVLETMGFTTINLSSENWSALPEWERSPYLVQQIRLKCQNIQVKESCA